VVPSQKTPLLQLGVEDGIQVTKSGGTTVVVVVIVVVVVADTVRTVPVVIVDVVIAVIVDVAWTWQLC
jgi:uncharacterized membrane protein YqjE